MATIGQIQPEGTRLTGSRSTVLFIDKSVDEVWFVKFYWKYNKNGDCHGKYQFCVYSCFVLWYFGYPGFTRTSDSQNLNFISLLQNCPIPKIGKKDGFFCDSQEWWRNNEKSIQAIFRN